MNTLLIRLIISKTHLVITQSIGKRVPCGDRTHKSGELFCETNGYCKMKWNRRSEFKSFTKLFAFYFSLTLLSEDINPSFLPVFSNKLLLWKATSLRMKLWIQTSCNQRKKLVLHHIQLVAEGLGKYKLLPPFLDLSNFGTRRRNRSTIWRSIWQ